jgi:hypothetical protein
MASEMEFGAFRQETFATALTAASEGGASALGFHSGAKTVLLFACTL